MSLDTDLAFKLDERLGELMAASEKQMPRGMAHDEYLKACGIFEGWRQVKEIMLPEILAELQSR